MASNNGRKKPKPQNKLKPSIVRGGFASDQFAIDMLSHAFPKLKNYTTIIGEKYDVTMIEAVLMVEEKFLELTRLYSKVNGEAIPIPDEIRSAMWYWRVLINRYRQGDFRHTEGERKALSELASWTVDENRKLRNQEPVKLDLLNQGD